MAEWQPQYGQGLYGWGGLPDYRAAPGVPELVRSIIQQRQLQQQQLLGGVKSLTDAIQQQRNDDIANAIQYSTQYGVPLDQAVANPDQVPDYGGTSGLAQNIRQMQASALYKTYPTDVGDAGTMNLTNAQRLSLLEQNNRLRVMQQIAAGRLGGGTSPMLPQGLHIDPTTGMAQDAIGNFYVPSAGGRGWNRVPGGAKAPAQRPLSTTDLTKGYAVYPDQLADPAQQHGAVIDPATGQARYTVPGEKATHNAFGAGPTVAPAWENFLLMKPPSTTPEPIPKGTTVLPNDVVDMLRRRTGIGQASGAGGTLQPGPNAPGGTLQPGPSAPPPASLGTSQIGPTQDAIAYLQAHPDTKAQFDAMYGQGQADTYLNP